MALRLGGIFLILMGVALAVIGTALALAILGQPIPAVPGLAAIQPVLAKLAEIAALPAGSDWQALPGTGSGQMALAGIVAGGALALGGLWQAITGRRSAVVLALVLAIICGFAVASATAG
jgi:hypothetical protein